jgi:hypothetical protein
VNKPNHWALGDKVEIIDKNSPHFGKTGMVREIIPRDYIMLNGESGTMLILKIKLEGTKTIIDITDHPIGLDSQLKKTVV